MSKVFKTIGVIAGAVALIATGVGAIGGGSILGASLGSIGAVAGAVSTAASLASQLTAKPPNARGSVNGLLIGSNLPTPYLMGECDSAGVQVHDTGYGGTVDKVVNPYRFMVMVHSGVGPVQGHVGSFADFTAISYSGTAATGYYSTFLYRSLQLGARPEAASLAAQFASPPDWGSAYKLSGFAATAYSLKFDKAGKRFAGGVPRLSEVWQGVKVYDPRLDSSYPGGSGSQRINNEATWTYSVSPALHALAYAYGRYVNGVKVFGADLGAASIDLAAFVAWANVCAANGWEVAGTIYEPGDKWNNLKRICEAGAAEPVFKGGLLTVKYSAPRIALDTITGDDLADGDISFRPQRPWKERLNGVTPKYRSSAHQWEYVQSTLVQNATARTEDGEDKIQERQFDLVKSKDQAAQLAGYLVGDAREAGPLVLPCKPRLMEYRIGDVLTVDLPEALPTALNNSDFVITARAVDPGTGIVTLTLYSETAAKHSFALGQSGTAPATKTIITPEQRDGAISTNASDPNSTSVIIQNSFTVGLTMTSSDTGSSTANIVISNHTRRYLDGDRAITGVTLTGLLNATEYYIYYDDGTRAVAAPTFIATTTAANSVLSATNSGRHFVGSITTQATGVGGSVGGTPGMAPGGIEP